MKQFIKPSNQPFSKSETTTAGIPQRKQTNSTQCERNQVRFQLKHAKCGQDDTAIAATTNISRFSAVRERVERTNGMTVLQAIKLSIYTLRTLRSDESGGYIALVRTSDKSVRDTDGDDLRSAAAGIWMDGGDDSFMSIPTDDFPFRLRQIASRSKLPARIPRLEAP
jgi:hypothetical protein